jgi:hypothetical protein
MFARDRESTILLFAVEMCDVNISLNRLNRDVMLWISYHLTLYFFLIRRDMAIRGSRCADAGLPHMFGLYNVHERW